MTMVIAMKIAIIKFNSDGTVHFWAVGTKELRYKTILKGE
jgi:hypothetical protein